MDTLDFLRANEAKGSSNFLKMAQNLKDNWIWLKYSYAVAIKVRRRMNDLGLTQKQLADSLGCTQQHISILLNGKVNMTLETLAKLEQALDFDLIGNSLTLFDNYNEDRHTPSYLNDSHGESEIPNIKTSDLVDGYKPRKKKGPKHIK